MISLLSGFYQQLLFLSAAIVTIALVVHRRRTKTGKPILEFNELAALMLALLGCIAGLRVVYLASSAEIGEKLESLVDFDGRVCVVIGGVATLWFAVKEIGNLFRQ